ncbi:MAG: hypothetical protein M3Q16_02405 [Pseudomonadota bacterium]|nr:hypothetical protein [Pseudomonadota bacterium]
MALTKTARMIVASTSNAAAGATRGTLALGAAQGGGFLTIKMTNGGTGPTAQCQANILVAHNATLPVAAPAGADWKTIASYGGGTTASAVTEIGMPIDPAIMCLEIEFAGNTGQAVTVEAYLSELTTVS